LIANGVMPTRSAVLAGGLVALCDANGASSVM